MFELARLIGTAEPQIVLETRRGTRVRNFQAPDPGQRARAVFNGLLQSHPNWVTRKDPCGIYNCFGHIWAARRTSIYEQSEVDVIRRDDGYRDLQAAEAPRPGDLAIYLEPADSSILHVGLISELRYLSDAAGKQVGNPAIWVLSKWNDAAGEVLHHLKDVPWSADDFRVEFWTDRT